MVRWCQSALRQMPKSMKSKSDVGCSFMLNFWAMISQVVIWYVKPSTMVSWSKSLFHLIIILQCPTNILTAMSSICVQLFFPICDNNYWHVHVVNIPASRVEILSLLPLRRGNGISAVSRCLSDAIDKAFHAHGMLRRFEVSKFQHVQPQIMQQLNRQITLTVIILRIIKYAVLMYLSFMLDVCI